MKFKQVLLIEKSIHLLIFLIITQLIVGKGIAATRNDFSPGQVNSVETNFQQPNAATLAPAYTAQAETSKTICPAQLAREMEAIANRPQFSRARWGILIQTLPSVGNSQATLSQVLYAREAQRYFIPASAAKLFTSAAALHKLGPQFRIRTSIYGENYGENVQPNATVLRVVGRGDPSLTNAELQILAQQLQNRGITQIRQLIGDDQYFRGATVDPTWEFEDIQAGYGAPVNSLILNQNAVGITLHPQALGQPLRIVWEDPTETVGWEIENTSLTVAPTQPEFTQAGYYLGRPVLQVTGQLHADSEPKRLEVALLNPAQYFLRHFQQALANQQIGVSQVAIASSTASEIFRSVNQAEQPELAAVESAPLSELLKEVNQQSNNLYAESLLRLMGANQRSTIPSAQTTAEVGLTVVEAALTELGVAPESYALADGSGLSRHNLASPEALVQTLTVMAYSPEAAVYRNSLSVAGVNGTLQNRFRDTAVQGNLQGKTGAMSGVEVLSGYFTSPNYPPLVFTIMVNQSAQPNRTVRQAIDEMVLLLPRLRSC